MQPANPLLNTYRALVDQVVEQVGTAVRDAPSLSPYAGIYLAWRPVPNQLAEIDQHVLLLGEQIFQTVADQRLTDPAKSDQIATATADARTAVENLSTSVLGTADTMLSTVKELAFPKRPTPVDAAQEATLAGVKSDLRMVWDPTPDPDDILDAMGRSLSRSLTEGDQLATWLLASSHWPEDYLTSRGFPDRLSPWEQKVAQLLNTATPEDLTTARNLYRVLADPQRGLPVLEQLLNGVIFTVIEDLAGWRPTAWSPTPPSRVGA